MKEKDKKNPFNFSLDFKNWDTTKPFTFSAAFKRAEKDYFKNDKYSSLHKMHIYEKDEAEIVFEKIFEPIKSIIGSICYGRYNLGGTRMCP